MPLPQDIRPAFQDIQDIQDTVVRAEEPWIEQSPTSKMKVLWVSRDSSTWAVLIHWKKGHVARPHKHLGGAHAYIVSGKLQVRDTVLNAGDYVYEPSGVLHDATTALEDTIYNTRSYAMDRCCISTTTASPAILTGRRSKNCVEPPEP